MPVEEDQGWAENGRHQGDEPHEVGGFLLDPLRVIFVHVVDEARTKEETEGATDSKAQTQDAYCDGALVVTKPHTGEFADSILEKGHSKGCNCCWENGEPELIWEEDKDEEAAPLAHDRGHARPPEPDVHALTLATPRLQQIHTW